MEVNGSQNNPTNINDVLDDVNAAAAQADVLALELNHVNFASSSCWE